MKKQLLIILIILASRHAWTAPVAGVAYISYNTQRAQAVTVLLEQHIIEILKTASFGTVNPGMISREVEKNSCFEETCILRFADNAGLDLVITGRVEDRGDYADITLNAYSMGSPFNSRLVYSRKTRIRLNVSINAREFSLICEENAAFFIASLFRSFTAKSGIYMKDGKYIIDSPGSNGTFNVYSPGENGSVRVSGEAVVREGVIISHSTEISKGDYIVLDYFTEADRIEQFYTDRKSEIVFQKPSVYDTLFIILTTPIASVTMPFAAPYLGYYTFGDWEGLGLWVVNASPYIYLEARGFINSPSRLRDDKKNISRDDAAINYFAWYMALAGGISLFMDAYAHHYLFNASMFIGKQPFLGSNFTAGYLALVSNGGGQFYKGHRGWGYFYFHLNNALLYMTIREASRPETRDDLSGEYRKGPRHTDRALAYGSILLVSKIVEITHTLLSSTDLSCGETIDEYIIPQPLFTLDSEGKPVYGLSFQYRY